MNNKLLNKLDRRLPTAINDAAAGVLQLAEYSSATELRDQRTVTLTLRALPRSMGAIEATEAIKQLVYRPIGRKQKASKAYTVALWAIIADVLRGASYTPIRPCYRPMGASDFTREPMGHAPFKRALQDLIDHDFVRRIVGKSGFDGEPGFVTRIFPTPRLTSLLAGYGIIAAECRKHFTYPHPSVYATPIQLRASSKRTKETGKVQGKRMRVDWKDPTVLNLARRMNAVNRFLSKHTISGPVEADLDSLFIYRSFNHGQRADHGYKLGGRMYPYGSGYYSLKRDERKLIKIEDGETVEVDISACFLTLAYYLLGMQLPNPGDPYEGTDLPRPIVKAWINMTLSNYGYHKKWPESVLERLAESGLFDVPDLYPIETVENKIRLAMPAIDRWMSSHFTWANLHHEESEIMLAAMEELAFTYGVPSLPIHDSLRVPISKKGLAIEVIRSTFLSRTGLDPVISPK